MHKIFFIATICVLLAACSNSQLNSSPLKTNVDQRQALEAKQRANALAIADQKIQDHIEEEKRIKQHDLSQLDITDTKIQEGEYDQKYVVGTVKNNSGKELKNIEINIMLYDDSGAQVGETVASVTSFEKDGTWKMKAIIFQKEATKFKIKKIDSF
ncbi:hypothetical protein GK047_24255 [Paenibacillus sp. SYP-B3998]|uniref:Lipoprotein n=1 Tax=Paenibacillus sp. SYP-B3998 TaxID=2678564 RepID=A0A6G4A3P9_9BACL|nr:FxLYD domain-containing protein [Paenibacillus sp. SYP-B3998]NEW09093.1 hypothetical protein [Paenibacillus sp. SYP-B3998]